MVYGEGADAQAGEGRKMDMGPGRLTETPVSVAAALDEMTSLVEMLHKDVSVLSDRLEPAMGSDFADSIEKSPGSDQREGVAPLIARIVDLNRGLNIVHRNINQVTRRVQL